MQRGLEVLVVSMSILSVAGVVPEPQRGAREQHLRVRTARGPVHLWTPAAYDPTTAATVVYVHGYFANVDDAWSAYHLREQFRDSGLNALFIACEAPSSERDAVSWTSLASLLELVAGHTGQLPEGRLVALGHSGAHRTLASWLDEPKLDTIALIDAGYGDLNAYGAWLEIRSDRRLIDVGDLTRRATDAFHEGLPETVVVERFPPPDRGELPTETRDARVVYVRSRMGHMRLVTRGVAIPMILRALAAPLVPEADRSSPLVPR